MPGAYGRNVERLAHTLGTLNAELGIAGRPDPRGLDWRRMDLRELAPCTFMTATPTSTSTSSPRARNGYRDLFQDADRFDVGRGVRPYVASLDDLDRVGHAGAPRRRPSHRSPPPGRRARAPRTGPRTTRPSPPRRTRSGRAASARRPAAGRRGEDDYDPGIWTEEEFRAIRSGRITF